MINSFKRGMILSFLFFVFQGELFSQTTYQVKVMSWNILNFPGSSPAADSALRCPEYRKVVNYVQPDILVTVENTSATGVSWILSNVMNSGAYHYQQGTFINGYDSDNAIYYRDSLFRFISNIPIQTALRDISHFTLKFIPTGDTLHIFAVHLKASQGYETNRRDEVALLRNVTNALPAGTNFLVAGDFNFYTSSEPGYQLLLQDNPNDDGNFNDALSLPGTWNYWQYARYHTQSTRLNSVGGGSTGGMNDRFDMILYSNAIEQQGGIYYSPGTFDNIGNDGNHFDDAVNYGTNSAVPSYIADALYNSSDHLPVKMTLIFGPTIGIDELNANIHSIVIYPNPVETNSIVRFSLDKKEKIALLITDMTGKVVFESSGQNYQPGENQIPVNIPADVSEGIYLLSLSGDNILINKRLNILK